MAIIEHDIDFGLSKDLYESCKHIIRPRECYTNIFHVSTDYMRKFRTGEWKIAYGYASVYEGIMGRHCFIVDADGMAIDPTFAQFDYFDGSSLRYMSFKIYDKYDDYIKAIERNNHRPDLYKELRSYDNMAYSWAVNRNLALLS